MKLELYIEKDAFETIMLFQDEYPNWHEITFNHSTICLNINQKELEEYEISEGDVIFEYINASGNLPKALSSHFQNIADDISIIAEKPRAVHILNLEDKEVQQATEDYGVLVHNLNTLNSNDLSKSYYYEYAKDEVVEDETAFGWHKLLREISSPINTAIIQDNYFFKDVELGKSNLFELMKVILPKKLEVPFHFLLIVQEKHAYTGEIWISKDQANLIAGNMNTELNNLRDYEINVEVVFQTSEHYHKRRLITNYVNASCDHGFCFFKTNDKKTVKYGNDLRWNEVFCNVKTNSFSDFKSVDKGLKLIKNESKNLAKKIVDNDPFETGAINGKCNPDKTLSNRLINDIF